MSMDNNLNDNGGKYEKVGSWLKKGWKSTGKVGQS
jgi:hypothetical protein